jgi:hypothetical protein
LSSKSKSTFVTKLHVAAFLFRVAGRDASFGRDLRLTVALAIARQTAGNPYLLLAAGLTVMIVAYNALG